MAEKYRHLYVVIEHEDGEFLPVSLEMVGEARRLMDSFNTKYSSNEKVVAVILGHNVQDLSKQLIEYGADAVVYADNPELKDVRNTIYTKVIGQIVQDTKSLGEIEPEYASDIKRPRYMFFAADSIGRHLSSTTLVELESGLASDINKLVIEDIEMSHQQKTGGTKETYAKTLEMYRPDFSGFLWTTILCLDNRNPAFKRDYHPQSCSIIPGVFEPLKRDSLREGKIIEFTPTIDPQDLKVKVLGREIIKSEVDFETPRTIVSFGRGIKDDPEQNIKLIENLAKELNAEIGVTLPMSKKPYQISQALDSKYMIPARVIGTSGHKTSAMLYVAAGVSGAMQHVMGMKDSGFVVGINPDEDAPIKNECDVFIKGRMEDVIPLLIEEIKKQIQIVEVQ
ncbi:electron transfer flavoprotein subunit alpha/FixB family protein [Nitrosopumilus ureiphilus]|uniref:electron transfer flavoprotein subunit alpha/FixB family protein n=1 Tax=Nitrosopumilus ureiphilus TaxID=1470067 RepID=UPI001C54B95E|nr:electron transfer flavoprotein subunit alpha/FixB family protein [Nitrosopumilus ureiphilus]